MTPTADPLLEKPPPTTTKSRNVVAIVFFVTLAIVLWLVVAYLVLFVAPRFARRFADFRMLIPVQSEWVVHEAWWIAPVCLVAALLCCIARPSRRIGLAL